MSVRYRAILQKYDEPKIEVANSESLDFVERAALTFYAAHARAFETDSAICLKEMQRDHGNGPDEVPENFQNRLAAGEWNIALYKRTTTQAGEGAIRTHHDEYLGFVGVSWDIPDVR